MAHLRDQVDTSGKKHNRLGRSTRVSITEGFPHAQDMFVDESPVVKAEEEQSPTGIRGRPRSRTKQLRRRGIDLSRDELRISSRWPSGEKKSMENFRDAIREKALGTLQDGYPSISWQPLKSLESAKKIFKEKMVKSLHSSRSRMRQRRGTSIDKNTTTEAAKAYGSASIAQTEVIQHAQLPLTEKLDIDRHHKPPPLPLRKVKSSINLSQRYPSPSNSYLDSDKENQDPDRRPRTAPFRDRQTSWQRHLEQDLQHGHVHRLRERKARYLLREDFEKAQHVNERNQDIVVLPSDYFPDYSVRLRDNSDARPLLQPSSSSIGAISERDVEEYWRLPSLPPDVAARVKSMSTASTHAAVVPPQTIAEIAGSAEFDSAWHKQRGVGDSTPKSESLSSDASRSSSDEYTSPTTQLIAALKKNIHLSSTSTSTTNNNDSLTTRLHLQQSSSPKPSVTVSRTTSTASTTLAAPTTRPKSPTPIAMSRHYYFDELNAPSPRYYDRVPSSRIVSQRTASGLASSVSLPENLGSVVEYESTEDVEGYGLMDARIEEVKADLRSLKWRLVV